MVNLVFLHGWGMNKGIWSPFLEFIKPKLPSSVKLSALNLFEEEKDFLFSEPCHLLDLIADKIASQLKTPCILVGWSMGGLVAQRLVDRNCPNVVAQIQVCSTPKFEQSTGWEGIKPEVLRTFAKQLSLDHQTLLKRFIAIQSMGLDRPKHINKLMLDALLQYPLSTKEVLECSLDILSTTDIRPDILPQKSTVIPAMRVFGELDSLVPKRVIAKISTLYPHDEIELIKKASHAPFISHSEHLADLIIGFNKRHF